MRDFGIQNLKFFIIDSGNWESYTEMEKEQNYVEKQEKRIIMKNWQKLLAVFSVLFLCISVGITGFSALEVLGAQKKALKCEEEMGTLIAAEKSIQESENAETAEGTDNGLEEAKSGVNETEEFTESLTETEENLLEEISSNGHVVGIDPGHQGSWVDMSAQEPNAPGSSTMKTKCTVGTTGRFTGVPEYELNLEISLALRDELVSRGYEVIMTRENHDTAISNAERAQKVSEEGGEIYVRIHANGSDSTSVSGALGMCQSPQNPYVGDLYEDSYRLTESILNSYCEETGFGNLGIQYYDNMTGINWSSVPVTILEMGFMTNEQDDYAMQDPEMQIKMVQGIANGIDTYFEVEN